ncbi:VRR-NUC domain-containing protein [Vibrio parahaemolyticus]|uniref:VRR-NUC domain-containing protein n=1 Tax=Vibrio parahaemolyticus TaxID=670 RepID=UPI00112408BD|nr:VRR-NUC domain-containing protein [Vibrio parahaemolyticus]TOG31685.1 nuclease [Vibrio parahaemolyticus]
MKLKIEEVVIRYPKDLLDSWKQGDKSWIPEQLYVPNDVHNQQSYHFGEYFTLAHYSKLGWQGTAFYALGDWEPNNPKYTLGRDLVAKHLDPKKLAVLKAIRGSKTSGEPDLFLYRENGSILFLEVKKESDRISVEQLLCLAQIKSIFGFEVGVVYLAETNQNYTPKTYELDVIEFPKGWL